MKKLKQILKEIKAEHKSAGVIVYHILEDEVKYLLLFGGKIGWGFPKGGIDEGETPKDAAIRETKEETGISSLEFIPNFEEVTYYTIKHDFSKTPPAPLKKHKSKSVIFYLAKANTDEVNLSYEHDDYCWVTYKKAQTLLKFNQELIGKAHERIVSKSN